MQIVNEVDFISMLYSTRYNLKKKTCSKSVVQCEICFSNLLTYPINTYNWTQKRNLGISHWYKISFSNDFYHGQMAYFIRSIMSTPFQCSFDLNSIFHIHYWVTITNHLEIPQCRYICTYCMYIFNFDWLLMLTTYIGKKR